MAPRFREFDTSRLKLRPLSDRVHDLDLSVILPLEPCPRVDETFSTIADLIVKARDRLNNSAVVLMAGAHVLRSGVQRFLIDLMEKGFLSCIAFNGAGVIHDYELALIGATTESVANYIKDGRFGLWRETGVINDIVSDAAKQGLGLGEAVGRFVEEERLPNRDISILAAGYRLGIPITVHVGVGYDIVHEHPNCDGAAYGATSYTDFLRFAAALESLEGGVAMNFGSAVMAPEVFLKALSMVRNAASSEGRRITDFATLVCDIKPLPSGYREEACREDPNYYFRPWKTLLVRSVAEGGRATYFRGLHRETVPQLWTAVMSQRAATQSP